MSNIKALDKLRELATGTHSYISNGRVLEFVNEIEQEIAERYIELPLDADGVPIHVGDKMRFCDFNVQCAAVSPEHIYYWDEYSNGHWVKGRECRHYKPRTVEDVLRDCCNEWNKHCGDEWESGVYVKYTEEIRGMMA